MNFGILIPIVAILASAWVAVTFIRYKQGVRPPGSTGASDDGARQNAELAGENEALRRTVARLEQRMAVLEEIATDPAQRTAREIEQLRSTAL